MVSLLSGWIGGSDHQSKRWSNNRAATTILLRLKSSWIGLVFTLDQTNHQRAGNPSPRPQLHPRPAESD